MSFPPQPAKRRQIVGTHFVLTNYGDKDRKRTHFSFFSFEPPYTSTLHEIFKSHIAISLAVLWQSMLFSRFTLKKKPEAS